MRRAILAVLVLSLVLPAISGCKVCFWLIDGLLSPSQEFQDQVATSKAYEADKQEVQKHQQTYLMIRSALSA